MGLTYSASGNYPQPSAIIPNKPVSAYATLYGNYDFNRAPLAPPGTCVVMHVKPQQRGSWSFHGEGFFYIGPAPEHYRCVQCLI